MAGQCLCVHAIAVLFASKGGSGPTEYSVCSSVVRYIPMSGSPYVCTLSLYFLPFSHRPGVGLVH